MAQAKMVEMDWALKGACLGALEPSWDSPPTHIQEQAKGDWEIDNNSQDIGSNGCAQANSSLKISKALD